MKASPSLKFEGGTSGSFGSSASVSSPDQRDFISHKRNAEGTTSSPTEAGGMFQLDSLTAAATAVERKSNESNKNQKDRKLIANYYVYSTFFAFLLTLFIEMVQSRSSQASTSNSSIGNMAAISLPPISKVFPEHFGVHPKIPMTFKPNSPGSILPPSQHAPQYQGYPRSNGPMGAGIGPIQNPSNYQGIHYANAMKNLQMHQQRSGPHINYYQNAHALGLRPVPVPVPAAQQVVPMYSKHVAYSLDRKRSYPHQNEYPLPLPSPSAYRSAAGSTNAPRPLIVHNPMRSLLDSSSNINSVMGTASTIQMKLNFRNFAMQLSSKATNLTSNQSGTAAADKEHFAAVMQDCVIATSVDFINSFPDYRPTVNNKLKPLKFIEFVQEQIYLHYSESTGFLSSIPSKDDLVFFYRLPDNLAAKHPEMARFRIYRHSKNIGIAVYRNGQRIFPVTPEDIADFWSEVPRNKPVVSKERTMVDLKDDDMVLICRGYGDNLESEADSLAEDASKVTVGGDLDDMLPPPGHVLDDLMGETATVIAVLGSEFDEHMLRGSQYRVRHVIHVEKSGHTAIDEPWPYAITKHTLVARPYLAMLYSDASKINRFSPTIEFILKKAKAAPLGESILKLLGKLSEIQHMAAGIVSGDKLRYWASGGAFLVHLRRENPKSIEWQVSFPGMTTWSIREAPIIPIGEMAVEDGDCLLLCCPEIRFNWSEAEIVSVIKSRALWPDKFQILMNRLREEKNSKNGLGLYEIILPQ